DQHHHDRSGAERGEQRGREPAAGGRSHGDTRNGPPVRFIAQISTRDRELTSSVSPNSRRPTSTSAEKYRSSAASVNSLARTAAIGYCGINSDADTRVLSPMTSVTAMVSPSARPRPSMTAPTIPDRA